MPRKRLCTHIEKGRCLICRKAQWGKWYKNNKDDAAFKKRKSADSIAWAKNNPEARAVIAKRRNQKAYAKDPLKIIARACIGQQVKRGNRPAARELPCDTCGKPADHYHHYLGYSQEHRYDVIPLCAACHTLEHLQVNP